MKLVKESLKILLLSLVAAVAYGVLHDHVTSKICLEYFTLGDPQSPESERPTFNAFLWGLLATWWLGLILGLMLVIAARYGNRPKLKAIQLILPVFFLLVRVALFSAIGGTLGYSFAKWGWAHLPDSLVELIPGLEFLFMAVLWAHAAAYGSAAFGGIMLAFRVWKKRKVKKTQKNIKTQ